MAHYSRKAKAVLLDNPSTENYAEIIAFNKADFPSGGGGGGTNDHNQLVNKNLGTQHDMSTIGGLQAKVADLDSHLANAANPHNTTAAQVGATPAAHASEVAAANKASHVKPGVGLSVAGDGALSVQYGSASGTACQGDDVRLGNARTPTQHAASHKSTGGDPLSAADVGAVAATRKILVQGPLSGGGDLSADRTISIADATTSQKGAAQLSSATNSASETEAATPKAVKAVADGLAGKAAIDHTHTPATTSAAGFMSAGDKAKLDALNGDNALVGEIKMVAHAALPSKWLYCYGQAVSRTAYSALFLAIGTVFGPGDGSTTFNLPDFRGRAPIGAGGGPGLTPRSIGTKGGAETHTLSVAEMPVHLHDTNDGFSILTAKTTGAYCASGSARGATAALSSSGGDQAHNNMQPWSAVIFIIYAGA